MSLFPRSHRHCSALVVVATSVFFASACDGPLQAGPGGTADDGDVVILDGGFVVRDGGSDAGATDAGVDVVDAGTDDGGFVFPNLDGGFPDIDGGLIVYTGEAEEGVRCGTPLQTCAAGAPCCVALDGFNLTGQCGEVPSGGDPQECDAFVIGCDDRQEDCSGDDVCCFILEVAFPLALNASCMPAAQCAAIGANPDQPDSAETCVASSDCAAGQECCGVDVPGVGVPLDIGVCQASCEAALP